MTNNQSENKQRLQLDNLLLSAEQEQLFSKTVVDTIHGSFFMLDENARFVRWNAYLRDKITGKTDSEMAGVDAISFIHPDDRPLIHQKIANVLNTGVTEIAELRVLLHGGPKTSWRLITGRRIIIDGKTFLVGMGFDITDRKHAEDELCRLNRVVLATSNCNHALIHTSDEMELLQKICSIIFETGDYRMAWVGYAVQDKSKSISPVAQAGFENGYLETLKISWGEGPLGVGPAGTAIRTAQPCFTPDIKSDPRFELWRHEAIKRDYASVYSIPLMVDEIAVGALTIYSESPDAFNAKEVALLTAMADNLSFGITTQRNRVSRELAESLLTRSEKCFRTLFEQHSAIKFLLDPDTGHIIDANKAAADFYGWSTEELRQMNIRQINPCSSEVMHDTFEKVRFSKQHRFLFKHNRADGSFRDVEIHSNLIKLEDKDVLYAIVHDNTERRRFELLNAFRIRLLDIAETSSVETLLKITLEEAERITGSSIGFFHILDDDHSSISNRTWSAGTIKAIGKGRESGRKFNMKESELLSDTVREQRALICNDESPDTFYRVTTDGYRAVKREVSVPVKRGDTVLAVLVLGNKPDKYTEDDITLLESLADTAWDIVARKRSELSEQGIREALIQSQKMELIGQLAGGIAHDLNNMLGVIIGNVEMAMDREEIQEPLQRNFKDILNATEHSANLTRQLLAFARKEPVMPIVLDLSTMIEKMLSMLRRLIGENISVVWVPESHPALVKVDPSQIDQVLVNLCLNSRDAIGGIGQITIETTITTVKKNDCTTLSSRKIPGEYVMLSVTDNGCGIEKEHQPHIFEPFFTTKEKGKGIGLGLSTVYGIVKQNNGFIEFQSELNKGTAFKIYLPRHRGYTDPDESEQPELPVKLARETILLVEDEPEMLHLSQRMLEKRGYMVLSASKPDEAIKLAQKHNGGIDLLLTDVVMPGMNGCDLSKKLQSAIPQLKTLFMSGYTTDVFLPYDEPDERIHFIQKPFSFKSLMMTVHEIINSR